MTNQEKIKDIIIIGAGPTGLFASFYACLRNLSVGIIDSLPAIGGQPAILYPEKKIYDIGGIPSIKGIDLINNQLEQLELFSNPPTFYLNQEVTNVILSGEEGLFTVETTVDTYFAKAVIIAVGNGAFQPRKVKVENLEQFEHHTLHYYRTLDIPLKNSKIAILGGGDSAVELATELAEIGKEVSIIHRRDQFRAHEFLVDQLHASKVNVLTPYLPLSLKGSGNQVQSILLQKVKSDEIIEVEVDTIFMNYGFSSSWGQIKNWGLNMTKDGIVVDSRMESSIPGVYAIGDAAVYPGKVELIATGMGEAPVAVSDALKYIRPNERVSTIHSTTLFEEHK